MLFRSALRFVNWLGAQPHKHKIFIAGNHDLYLEQGNPSDIAVFLQQLPTDVHYLQDSGIELEGITFWGSPVQPRFFNWAFNRDRGADIKKHWDLIPYKTDVLITHGPAYARQDEAPRVERTLGMSYTERVGCKDLLNAIKIIKPKIHAFGHIHYSYGHTFSENVHHFNASICNEGYVPNNKPFLVDLNGCSVEKIDIL